MIRQILPVRGRGELSLPWFCLLLFHEVAQNDRLGRVYWSRGAFESARERVELTTLAFRRADSELNGGHDDPSRKLAPSELRERLGSSRKRFFAFQRDPASRSGMIVRSSLSRCPSPGVERRLFST